MRGIIVETKVITRNIIEHSPPDSGATSKILPARPFVRSEQHGTVLNADTDTLAFRVLDDWFPSVEEPWPIVINAFGPVATNECVHSRQAQF